MHYILKREKLINDLYTVLEFTTISAGKYLAMVELNPWHDIFKGHFPNHPVMPGVCMMQIIKELSQEMTDSRLQMTTASNVKFMAIINPKINPILHLEISIDFPDDNSVRVKNITSFDQTIALKMSTTYKRI